MPKNDQARTPTPAGHMSSTDEFGAMKLTLPVPTKKISGPGWTRFDYESREVDVAYLTRRPTGSRRLGWHYNAGFDHPDAHPDYPRIGMGGLLVAWVRRADHPLWMPPPFPDGANSVWLKGLKTPNKPSSAQVPKQGTQCTK